MPRITIDGREVGVADGCTVLDGARSLGIEIPTLCHVDSMEPFTSCMVCQVKDVKTGRFLPACSAPAVDGMAVESDTEEVRDLRKAALELLLSEHVGDCEAPCSRICPVHPDIPEMIRLIAGGRREEAALLARGDLAFPALLGRLCPAPCEKGCRRSRHDGAVSIRLLERFAGEVPVRPLKKEGTGKTVAIVGAGPAGLSSAFFLLREGHAVRIIDEGEEPGGGLRTGVPEEVLPRDVLEAEINVLRFLGAEFRMKTRLGAGISLDALQRDSNGVILAVGAVDRSVASEMEIPFADRGFRVDGHTFQAGLPGVFVAGSAVLPRRSAVRAVAHGKAVAASVHRFLTGGRPLGALRSFDSRIGALKDGEMGEFLKGVDASPRVAPAGGEGEGYSESEAGNEAGRCLSCDCRKASSCRLRRYATEFSASPKRYGGRERRRVERVLQHEEVVFEPGKCILCGLCVRTTKRRGETTGLAFTGRGFDVRVSVPFRESLEAALQKSAAECVGVCPTGALAFRKAIILLLTVIFLGWFPSCRRGENPRPLPPAPAFPVALPAGSCWPIFRNDPQLTGRAKGRLPDALTLRWTFRTGDEIRSSPVIGPSRVFVGSFDGKVYALNLANGKKAWAFDTGDAVEASPLLLDGTIYVGSLNGVFFAIDAGSGEKKWAHETGAKIVGSANWVSLRGEKGKRILFGSHDCRMYCLDAGTGRVFWTFEAESYINGSPAVHGENIVFGGCDSKVYVVSAKDGSRLAAVEAGSYVPASVAVGGDRAYLCHFDNEIVCIDLARKEVAWRYGDDEEGSPFFSSPAVGRDRVVAGSQDGKVHCVQREDGGRLWAFRTLGHVDSSPVLCGDKVVVGSDDGRLYLLRLSDGTRVWSYEIGEAISGSPAVVPGIVVVGAGDGSVYAFGPASNEPVRKAENE